ncbi:DUF4189 domain-containing protein [Planktomarina temperata]|nr:DUF4189 domain-containing protein [Planktomarina temperata]
MLKKIIKLQLVLWAALFAQQLSAQEKSYMSFDDFLFDIQDYVNTSVNVQVPIYAVDIPSRQAQVDGALAVDLKQINRQTIKDIITLCDGVGGSCFLDVSGSLVENPDYFPTYIIKADNVTMWFSVGVAVSESGYTNLHTTEQYAINAMQQATAYQEGYLSGHLWINSPGVVAVAYGAGGGSYFIGYSFNADEKTAKNEAEKKCNEQIGPINKLLTSCSAQIFKVPWW